MKRTVSVVVPVKDNLFYTKGLIESIFKHVTEPESVSKVDTLCICVVNNGSTDGTKEYLENLATSKIVENTDVKVFFNVWNNEQNLGYGVACNQGMKFCLDAFPDSDVLFMNNDMQLIEGCIDALIDCAYSKDDIGIVGGRLLFADGGVQHAGAFLNVFGWGQHKGAGGRDEDEFNNQKVCEVEYTTGALFFIKNELIRKLGGFDERFEKAYFEEVSYVYDARKLGYKTYYTPKAKAYHYENTTGKQVLGSTEAVSQLSRQNQIRFYLKHDEDSYEFTSDDRLLLTSKIYGDWSFSVVMRNLAKGLSRNGVDVAIAPEEYHNPSNVEDWEIKQMINKPKDYWNRYVLRSSEGDQMYLMPPGKKRIAHTTGESTRISRAWRDQLNNVDQVITTSNFFKSVLLEHGVRTPVYVVPNAVDIENYNPSIKPVSLGQNVRMGKTNFVSMFHYGERKSPETVFRAFIQEFGQDEDVTLTVHSLSMHYVLHHQYNIDVKQWLRSVAGDKSHPPIYITSSFISDLLVPHFIKNFNVFILASRAEGFGLPVLEAGACGLPSIVTGYSGLLDYATEDVSWHIGYDLVDIPLQTLPYFRNYVGGKWAEPSVEDLRKKMRYAHEHPEEVKLKGEAAAKKAEQYSIENIGRLAKDVIFG